ncbi:hypothetical protein [Allocatelliglobosispora scoriae]|nr:hypothetical protein [Allocatelliglobosispora scoriae]
MLMGIIVARCVVRVPTIADEDLDSIVVATADALQALLVPAGTGSPA